jgi:hypothetical protein
MQTIQQKKSCNIHCDAVTHGQFDRPVLRRRWFPIIMLGFVLIVSFTATAAAGTKFQGTKFQGTKFQGTTLRASRRPAYPRLMRPLQACHAGPCSPSGSVRSQSCSFSIASGQ